MLILFSLILPITVRAVPPPKRIYPRLYSNRATNHWRSDTSARLEGLLAERTSSPQGLASERLFGYVEEKLNFDRQWSLIFSGSAWVEGEYYNYLQYPQQLRDEDSREVRLQDSYLQLKTDHFLVRAGYQQIVWGETFGSFYADVVTAKDLRQGVPEDNGQIRLASPALNTKYINGRFALQAVFLPQSYYNILPLAGSDFSLPLEQMTGYPKVTIEREKTSAMSIDHSEWGGRLTQTIGNVDLSVFGLSYYDRSPYYSVGTATIPGVNLDLIEHHSRINSAGGSLAADLNGFVLRGEGVYTTNRYMPITVGTDIVDTLTNEFAFAAALDFPTWHKLNLTLQVSESRLSKDQHYLLRKTDIQYITVRALYSLFTSSSVELVATYSTVDQGLRTQAQFTFPLSNIMEAHVGLENYNGPADSDFGELAKASRAYVAIIGRFDAGRIKADF